MWIMIVAWAFVLVWVPIIIYTNRKLHPKALFLLFFAELWERFSYYGMRVLLTLYMVKEIFNELGQAEADTKALGIYGSYTAMVYLFPVVGGLLADKILGFRKAILFGGSLMMVGHFALALEGMFFGGNMTLFFLSLAFIIVGNGFFKPNISSFLGDFYGLNDSRKDGAFTIFYMGVNIGALLSIVTCGYVGQEISWDYGFGLAGIGMLIGLLVFWHYGPKILGKKGINPGQLENFPEIDETKAIEILHSSKEVQLTAKEEEGKDFVEIKDPALRKKQVLTMVATVLFVPICSLFLNLSDIVTNILIVLSVGILGYILYVASKEKKVEGQRLWVVVILFIFHAIFWALFEQAGGSITLFTDRNVDREVLGSQIPASIFQFFNAFFIMTLAPVFSWMWIKLRNKGKEPSTPMKFVLGLAQLAIGYGFIVLGANFFADSGLVPIIFLVVMYLFHTMGELSLSPVGLSMITKLSPKRMVGFIMGVWFLSISLANKMAGKIGELTAGNDLGENASSSETLEVYSSTYLIWGVFVVGGAALMLFFLVPTLRKWMNGIH